MTANLLSQLRAWRDQTAGQAGVEKYRIFPNKTLELIAELKPQTTAELRNIKGIGDAKLRQFGPDILELTTNPDHLVSTPSTYQHQPTSGPSPTNPLAHLANEIITVSQLNRLTNELLSQVKVKVIGELDDRFDSSRGHGYGKLKDANASIDLFIPAHTVRQFADYLIPGSTLVLDGYLNLYEPTGRFSLTVTHVEPQGEGQLLAQLKQLKQRLQTEGLFDLEIKKPLPPLPRKIGLITAKDSAAYTDFMTHATSHYQGLHVYFFDAVMQGAYCTDSVLFALRHLTQQPLDVIVITRGGGSLQDLMGFNSEQLVRAIRQSPVPIVSAVGHEIDWTLADLAADIRVSTPTKAAELIAQTWQQLRRQLDTHLDSITTLTSAHLTTTHHHLSLSFKSLSYYHRFLATLPTRLDQTLSHLSANLAHHLTNLTTSLVHQNTQLARHPTQLITHHRQLLHYHQTRLKLLSPKNTLHRGYSITYLGDKIITSADQAKPDQTLTTTLADGQLQSQVI